MDLQLQRERNALLQYALLHPPPNVSIMLPKNVKHVSELDLTTCPLPLETYDRAEASSTTETLTFDIASFITFQSEGHIVVPRATSNAVNASDAASPPAAKTQLANKAMTTVAGNSSSPRATGAASPTAAGASTSDRTTRAAPLSATEERPRSGAVETGPAMQPSAGGGDPKSVPTFTSASSASTAPLGTAAAAPPANSWSNSGGGVAGQAGSRLGPAMKGHHSSSVDNVSNSTNQNVAGNAGSAAASTPTTTAGHRAGAKSTAARSLRSYLPSVFSGVSRTQEPKDTPSPAAASTHTSECGHDDKSAHSFLAPVRAWSFIPLHGTTPGTLRDTVASWLATAPSTRPLPFGAFPDLYNVSLCPLFDSTMLVALLGESKHTIYEHLLMANALLLGPDSHRASHEICNIFMPAFGVSTNDHMQCMSNLMPQSLRSAASRRWALIPSEVDQLRATLQCDEATLDRLIAASTDDEFIARMTDLRHTIRTYRDKPEPTDGTLSNTAYPFVLRATLFAIALVPLYRINPAVKRPYAEPGSIDITLSAMKRMLDIPDELVNYCALHAHLYANEEVASDLKAQSSFLKGIARAVNAVVVSGASSLQSQDLTPEVKYCFYVLQETLSLAMTPMPWLETLWSGDALRSVSALFVEVCLSLPPCFLSVFVLVDGQPLLYPQWSPGMCLLELLSFFMTVSAFRRFGDVAPEQVGIDRPVSDLLHTIHGIDDPQLAYAQMLSKSFPHALGLVCPLRMQFAMYMLRRHWSTAPWYKEGDSCVDVGKALTAAPPPDLVASLNAVMIYLLDVTRSDPAWNGFTLIAANGGCAADDTDELSQTMEVLALNAGYRLHALQPIVEQYDVQWMEKLRSSLRTVMSKGGWGWEKNTLAACEEVPGEAKRLVQQVANTSAIPPPLGSNPAHIYTTRMHMLVELTAALVESITEGVPGVLSSTRPAAIGFNAAAAAAGSGGTAITTPTGANGNNAGGAVASGAGGSGVPTGVGADANSGGGTYTRSLSQGGVVPLLTSGLLHPAGSWKPEALVEYDRLQQYHAQYFSKDPVSGPTATELVQRLSTLQLLRQELSGLLLSLQHQYERVARVTGARAVDLKPVHESLRAMIREAERLLCEGLGAGAVLRPCLLTVVTTQLMRWDENAYKALRRKERDTLTHYPLTFPDVTLTSVLTELQEYLLTLMPLLSPGAAVEFLSQTGLFLVCMLYHTYLEGSDVYLTPHDAQPILVQLETVRSIFFPAYTNNGRGGLGQDSAGATDSGGVRHQRTHSGSVGGTRRRPGGADISAGEQRLNELCSVFRYVMSRPSNLLIGGGNGVPPLNSLPDRADNSPWCKYIVNRVLAHRKDPDAKKQVSERGGFWAT